MTHKARQTARTITAAGAFLAALGGCALGEPEMKPGEWELRGWMENAAATEMKIAEQSYTQRLDAARARYPLSSIDYRDF